MEKETLKIIETRGEADYKVSRRECELTGPYGRILLFILMAQVPAA